MTVTDRSDIVLSSLLYSLLALLPSSTLSVTLQCSITVVGRMVQVSQSSVLFARVCVHKRVRWNHNRMRGSRADPLWTRVPNLRKQHRYVYGLRNRVQLSRTYHPVLTEQSVIPLEPRLAKRRFPAGLTSKRSTDIDQATYGEVSKACLTEFRTLFPDGIVQRPIDFGLVIMWWAVFLVITCLAVERLKAAGSVKSFLVFARRHVTGKRNDVESSNAATAGSENTPVRSDNDIKIDKSETLFAWKDLCYTVPVRGGHRQLLNKVQGFTKPGVSRAIGLIRLHNLIEGIHSAGHACPDGCLWSWKDHFARCFGRSKR